MSVHTNKHICSYGLWLMENGSNLKENNNYFFCSFCYFYILIQKYQKFEIEHWLSWNEQKINSKYMNCCVYG